MAKKEEEKQYVSCLRKEKVIVRFIPNPRSKITDKRHPLFGGMAEDSVRSFVVPKLSSGRYVNVLTDSEKDYLEEVMGLEPNALSIYKKENNFWDDDNPISISRVILHKRDTYLDLSSPEDYIRYKILLANKDTVAPSKEAYETSPKASYQYMIISPEDELRSEGTKINTLMQAFTEFGAIKDKFDVLKVVVETLSGKPVSNTTKIEFLQSKAGELAQSDPKRFLKVVKDDMLPTKVLLKKALTYGKVTTRGDFYYYQGKPLCEDNLEPTLEVACKYLNNPKYQSIKLSIEAELNEQK